MRRLEIWIRFIGLVSIAIVLQSLDFWTFMMPYQVIPPAPFINVVTQVNNEVEFFLRHVLVCGEISMFILLA